MINVPTYGRTHPESLQMSFVTSAGVFCQPRVWSEQGRNMETLSTLLLITQIPYIVRVPGKGRNGCILQPKPSNRTLSQLYEYQVGYSTRFVNSKTISNSQNEYKILLLSIIEKYVR